MNKPRKKIKISGQDIEKNNAGMFSILCREHGITGLEQEYLFAVEIGRRWRFDFAIPKHKLAIEIEGGIWITGRHNRGIGYIKDMEKYNHAALLGWRVLRFTPQQINKLETYEFISKVIGVIK